MKLFGMGAGHPDVSRPDEYWLDPSRGLAIVTAGLGVYDVQARAAAVLAMWSVVGEVAGSADDGAFARGARRAHEALERITLGWQELIRPTAMVAALRLSGSRVQIAHAGRCRISRVGAAGLEALTEDHDFARAAVRDPESTSALAPAVPPEMARLTTRALGVTQDIEVRDLAVEAGDELLVATPALQERLTGTVARELCRKDRPLVARAVALMDHACAQEGPFAFILVRAVPDGESARATGRTRPPAKSFFYAPGEPLPPPVPGLDRGPDERWHKEIAYPLCYHGTSPLDAELGMLVDIHPPESAAPALIRAVEWSLRSLAGRHPQVPAPLQALIEAVARTATLADWDDSRRAIERAFFEWGHVHLGDWASRQALDRVEGALDCLVEWARFPERPAEELGSVLEDLVYAEGMWDWDELAAEAALSGFGSIPASYHQMEDTRDARCLAARRALILVLTEVAPEAWARAPQPAAPPE